MTRRAVVRLDGKLDQVLSTDSPLELLKQDYFGLSEGPVWIPEASGYLLFSDIPSNAIYRWSPDNSLTIHLARSGYTGPLPMGPPGYVRFNGRLYLSNIGSNGITRDREGRLVFCASGDRSVVRIERDGSRTTLADRFEGKRLNRPNDLVIRSDGAVYFTDPRANDSPDMELAFSGVFLLRNGHLQLLEQGIQVPNGLAFSPNERFLYVASSADNKLFRYDVDPDGSIRNRQLFIDMSADSTRGTADGLKVDSRGNVYSTGPGGVWIVSSEGTHLGTVRIQGGATNLAFGDADAMTLYITTRSGLARIRLSIPGLRP